MVVSKIRNGTVIDHIEAGQALNVARILKISPKDKVLIAMNVFSEKYCKKDILKIEDRELKGNEVELIALISPRATINIVRDYEVVEKFEVKIPKRIRGLLRCSNPNCITNSGEPVNGSFTVVMERPLRLRCEYCERFLNEGEVIEQLTGREQA